MSRRFAIGDEVIWTSGNYRPGGKITAGPWQARRLAWDDKQQTYADPGENHGGIEVAWLVRLDDGRAALLGERVLEHKDCCRELTPGGPRG